MNVFKIRFISLLLFVSMFSVTYGAEIDQAGADQSFLAQFTRTLLAGKIFSGCREYTEPLGNGRYVLDYPQDIRPVFSKEDFEYLIGLYKRTHRNIQKRENDLAVVKIVFDQKQYLFNTGDIHGSANSLLRNLFSMLVEVDGNKEPVIKDDLTLKDNCELIFTGDYADRGRYGVEVWMMLMLLDCKNPGKVFLIKGNHEAADMADAFGFGAELTAKYGMETKQKMYEVFDFLPQALIVGDSLNHLFFTHGALPQEIHHTAWQQVLMWDGVFGTQVHYLPSDLSLQWSDFEGGTGCRETPRCSSPDHLPGVYVWGVDLVGESFGDMGVVTVICGHRHVNAAVAVWDNDRNRFWGLPHGQKIPLKQHPVFICTSCPEGLPETQKYDAYGCPLLRWICNFDGFARITIVPDCVDEWTIESFEYELPLTRNHKCVCMRENMANLIPDFCWIDDEGVAHFDSFNMRKESMASASTLVKTCSKCGSFFEVGRALADSLSLCRSCSLSASFFERLPTDIEADDSSSDCTEAGPIVVPQARRGTSVISQLYGLPSAEELDYFLAQLNNARIDELPYSFELNVRFTKTVPRTDYGFGVARRYLIKHVRDVCWICEKNCEHAPFTHLADGTDLAKNQIRIKIIKVDGEDRFILCVGSGFLIVRENGQFYKVDKEDEATHFFMPAS